MHFATCFPRLTVKAYPTCTPLTTSIPLIQKLNENVKNRAKYTPACSNALANALVLPSLSNLLKNASSNFLTRDDSIENVWAMRIDERICSTREEARPSSVEMGAEEVWMR